MSLRLQVTVLRLRDMLLRQMLRDILLSRATQMDLRVQALRSSLQVALRTQVLLSSSQKLRRHLLRNPELRFLLPSSIHQFFDVNRLV